MDNKEVKDTITEIYRFRDKIENIPNKSKPFKIYCLVSLALMGVVTIVALCTKIFGVAILSGFLFLVIALLFWSNNREYKKVRFAVSRRLPIMLGLLQILVIVALIGMISVQGVHGSGMSFFDEEADFPGRYVYTYTEEIEGEELEFSNVIVLNEDNTCEVTFQDTVTGEWHKGSMTLSDGTEYYIDVVGDELELLMDGEWYQYKRK